MDFSQTIDTLLLENICKINLVYNGTFNVPSMLLDITALWFSFFNLRSLTHPLLCPSALDYDLSKLKEFMDQQVDSYIEKGIIAKDEGDTIKRIYSSL